MKLDFILELPGKIKIYSNPLNWILETGNQNNRSYFVSLDHLCDELFDLRLQMQASKAKHLKDNIRSLIECVRDARQETREDLARIEKLLRNADKARRKGVFDSKDT